MRAFIFSFDLHTKNNYGEIKNKLDELAKSGNGDYFRIGGSVYILVSDESLEYIISELVPKFDTTHNDNCPLYEDFKERGPLLKGNKFFIGELTDYVGGKGYLGDALEFLEAYFPNADFKD